MCHAACRPCEHEETCAGKPSSIIHHVSLLIQIPLHAAHPCLDAHLLGCVSGYGAVDFYGDVLLELVTALGAALFVANVFALMRRRGDRRRSAREAVKRARPGSPVRWMVRTGSRSRMCSGPWATG